MMRRSSHFFRLFKSKIHQKLLYKASFTNYLRNYLPKQVAHSKPPFEFCFLTDNNFPLLDQI